MQHSQDSDGTQRSGMMETNGQPWTRTGQSESLSPLDGLALVDGGGTGFNIASYQSAREVMLRGVDVSVASSRVLHVWERLCVLVNVLCVYVCARACAHSHVMWTLCTGGILPARG